MDLSTSLGDQHSSLWLRRKASRSAAESALQHEGLSSDEEFDRVYDPSSIASLLTESNLQTSSC